MKKITLLVFLLAATVGAFAQSTLPRPLNPEVQDWIDGQPIIFNDTITGEPVEYVTNCQMMFQIGMDLMQHPVADDYPGWEGDEAITGELTYTLLDEQYVSYTIFTDLNEIFTFTPEHFPGQVTEPLTQFPYNGRTPGGNIGYWDIHFNGLTNEVEEGNEPFFTWRVGIQTNYTDGGQTNSSDIIYMEIYPQLKEAANVTSTSFLADWSCNAENTLIINNFIGEGCGYFLHVVDKATQEEVLVQNVAPANTALDEWGNSPMSIM